MAKKAPTLETPYRRGEKVQTTRAVEGIPEGTFGKVRLSNGLHDWRRYWVTFEDGSMVGQVSHEDLVRQGQLAEWEQREIDRANAAESAANASDAPEEAAAETASDAGGGVAALIPAHLLERSKAAKARLLGG